MPVVEGSEPLFEAGSSSARRNPVCELKIEASEMVTSIEVVFLPNWRVLVE